MSRALRELSDAGMGVGPHSHSHEVSIRLSPERQREEIRLSCDFVERNGGSRQWGYCYPLRCADQRFRRRPREPWPKPAARLPSPSRRVTSKRLSPRRRATRCRVTTAMPSRTARFRMERRSRPLSRREARIAPAAPLSRIAQHEWRHPIGIGLHRSRVVGLAVGVLGHFDRCADRDLELVRAQDAMSTPAARLRRSCAPWRGGRWQE